MFGVSAAVNIFSSTQAEGGTRAGNVALVSDSSASGSSAVKFGTTVTAGCVGAANTPGGPDPWGGCWPGPQNTGYPQGLPGDSRTPVTLTNYTGPMTIRSCGVVIDKKIVNGDLLIEAGNGTHSPDTPCVTITNSLVKGVIFGEQTNHGPIVIRDVEVDMDGNLSWWENVGRGNWFGWRINSHGSEGVLKCSGWCAAYDSWVHGMHLGGAYHYNAFGGNGIEPADGYFTVEHNYASCDDWSGWDANVQNDAGCSAVMGFYGDYGPTRNWTVNKNFMVGSFNNPTIPNASSRQSGYCINPGYYPGKPYGTQTINVRITDNIFGRGSTGKCGAYGPTNSLNGVGNRGTNLWSNNKYADGEVIPWPEE